MIKKLIKGTSVIAISNFLGKVFAFFTLSLIARSLGPQEFGQMAVILSVASIFSTFSATCFPQSLLWRMNDSSNPRSKKDVFSTSFFSIFFTILISSLFIYWITNDFIIIFIILVADSVYYLFMNLHLSQTNYNYVSIINILRSLIKFILISSILLIEENILPLNVYAAALVYPISMILSLIVSHKSSSSSVISNSF